MPSTSCTGMPRRTPIAPAPAASTMPAFGSNQLLACVRQQYTASSKSPTTAKAAAVRRTHAPGGASPLLEKRARALDVAGLDRELDVGEVVAELAKAEREIEHGDVERQREQAVHRLQREMQRRRSRHRRQHGDEPGDDTVAALAAVEGLLEPARPRTEHAVHRRRSSERTPLLDDERGDDREDAHAPILAARLTSIPAVAPQMVWP